MKEQFIPYEQALELKDLGFNENVISFYINKDDYFLLHEPCNKYINVKDHPYIGITNTEYIARPLWQQAFDYFRENHNLYFEIFNSPMHVHGWKFRTYYIENHRLRNADVSEIFNRYEDVKLACLIKLISIVKNLQYENRLQ